MRTAGGIQNGPSRTASEIMKPVGRLKSPARVTSLSPNRNGVSSGQYRTTGLATTTSRIKVDEDGRTKGGGLKTPVRGGEAATRIKSTVTGQSPIRSQRPGQSSTLTKYNRSSERTNPQNGEKMSTKMSSEHSTNSLRLVRNGDRINKSQSDRTASSQRYRVPDNKTGATIERGTGIPMKNAENQRNSNHENLRNGIHANNKPGMSDKSELVKTRMYSNLNNCQVNSTNREVYSSHSFNSLTRPRVDRSASRAGSLQPTAAGSKPWRTGSLKRGTVATSASPMVRAKLPSER
jgi:hypothetical protein